VPTPSLKYMHLGRRGRILVALFVASLVPLTIYLPWAMLIAGLLIYLATIPLTLHTLEDEDEDAPPIPARTPRRIWKKR
jgi:hypothetical protein